ncbi:hypothetical protein [Sphaerisporangium fuscum]|nr:hypothetical protein [Sphaerisporangium fuscum]
MMNTTTAAARSGAFLTGTTWDAATPAIGTTWDDAMPGTTWD